jgi:hypothetical protein
MPAQGGKPCPHADLIQAMARGQLSGESLRRAETILEQSEPCRELYRRLTAGRFPVLPNYTIIEQVGKGGFGVVYKAVHHAKERIEALKVLFSKTPLLTSYFQNEVHLIARLRHPNIATLFDAQLATPPLYYTMEFVQGERLSDALKSRSLSLAQRIEVLRATALALHYAHRQGVVHRDVKPQNVLLDAAGQPHIVDFGIAKRLGLEHERPEGAGAGRDGPVGTVGYIAPEQVRGDAVDARADIFSLGALLFHCATGEPARKAGDAQRCERLVRERGIGQAEDLAAIIARCVAPDPERRYESCETLSADLTRYLAGRAIRARRPRSVREQTARIAGLVTRSYPVQLRICVGLASAVALAGVFWQFGARTFREDATGPQTVIIGLNEATPHALRDDVFPRALPEITYDLRSWRAMHGVLMERLATARPAVVVWDYLFPNEQPEFDAAFAAGVRKLLEVGTPVVVGANFDADGEPILSPTIAALVYGAGTLAGVDPMESANEREVVAALQRGVERPIPGLALTAFGAYRFPDCSMRVDLGRGSLTLRYRRDVSEAGEPRRRRPESDTIAIHAQRTLRRVGGLNPTARAALRDNDVAHVFRFKMPSDIDWRPRTVYYHDVLAASDERLREWFARRPVIVGQMMPHEDLHLTRVGLPIYGVQVQAQALDAMLATRPSRFGWFGLLGRTLLWSAAAGLLVTVWLLRSPISLVRIVPACAGAAVGGILIAAPVAQWITESPLIELTIAGCSLLTSAGLMLLIRAIGARQAELAPESIRYSSHSEELPSTMLAPGQS